MLQRIRQTGSHRPAPGGPLSAPEHTQPSEAHVLHLNLRESYGGRRFALETDSTASRVVEATVFELRMAGINATGQVRPALIDRAADEIIAEATEWGADLIVLGFPRRGGLTTRLFGSVTLSVLQHAPCPVLVASPSRQASPAAR
jgi:nucleotide-binding universal stress UspA family protein